MSVLLDDLIVIADAAISGQGSAPSTLMQYRWAWSQFESFCATHGSYAVQERSSYAVKQPIAHLPICDLLDCANRWNGAPLHRRLAS